MTKNETFELNAEQQLRKSLVKRFIDPGTMKLPENFENNIHLIIQYILTGDFKSN